MLSRCQSLLPSPVGCWPDRHRSIAVLAAIIYYPEDHGICLHWQHAIADKRRACRGVSLISVADASGPEVCAVSAHPSSFDHQRLTLVGIVAGLTKITSRRGRKEMTFLLSSPKGCGGVIVYAQEPATLSNGDHLQVEGIFEIEHRRDGMTFHNEMQATKITAMPR
jgi:hypothetical protein